MRRKLCSLDGGTGVEFLQTWRSSGNCRFQDPDLRPGSLPPLCRGGLWWRRGWFFVKPATSDAPVTAAATSTASAAAATAAAAAATAAAASTAAAAATAAATAAAATTAAAAAKLHSNRRFRLHFAAGVPGQARHDRAGSRRPGGLQEPVGIDGDPGGSGLRATRAGARCRHGARQRPDRRSDRHRNRHRARCLRRQDRERAFLFRRNRRDRRSDFPRHGGRECHCWAAI